MDERTGLFWTLALLVGAFLAYGLMLGMNPMYQTRIRTWWAGLRHQLEAYRHQLRLPGKRWQQQAVGFEPGAPAPVLPVAPVSTSRTAAPSTPSARTAALEAEMEAVLKALERRVPPELWKNPADWESLGAHVRVPSYGRAADQVPQGVLTLLRQLEHHQADQLGFPMGWMVTRRHTLQLLSASFGDKATYNVLVTGQIGAGKDVFLKTILLTLALRNSPRDLQIAICDGKGVDYHAYDRLLPHLVTSLSRIHAQVVAEDLPGDPDERAVARFVEWLAAERNRRRTILQQQGQKNWHDSPTKPFPLLVVYISELMELRSLMSERAFWSFVNRRLSQDRAFGICYLIGTQKVAGTPTYWREQCQLAIFGMQAGVEGGKTNDWYETSLSATDWQQAGLTPPSYLPKAKGYFGYLHYAWPKGEATAPNWGNLRGHYVSDDEEERLLRVLNQAWTPARTAPILATELTTLLDTLPSEDVVPNQFVAQVKGALTPKNDRLAADFGSHSHQYDSRILDTNAVNADTQMERISEPVRAPTEPIRYPQISDQLSSEALIRLLATQRDVAGKWVFSANKIVDFVGGTRGEVLDIVRSVRQPAATTSLERTLQVSEGNGSSSEY